MWAAAGVTLLSALAFGLFFRSLGKLSGQVGTLKAERDEAIKLVEGLLQEIEALKLGDHGLSHADMGGILLPDKFRDDPVNDT